MREQFEDDALIGELQSAYQPFDAAACWRLRDRLVWAVSSAGETAQAVPRRRSLRQRAAVGVACLLAAIGAVGVDRSGVGSAVVRAAMSHLPFAQQSTPVEVGSTARGPFTFTPAPVPSSGVIGWQEAITYAIPRSRRFPGGAGALRSADPRFGLYSDKTIRQRPVWLVIFSNPGGHTCLAGGPAGPWGPATFVPDTDVVIVDARSGKILGATSHYMMELTSADSCSAP